MVMEKGKPSFAGEKIQNGEFRGMWLKGGLDLDLRGIK